jgi:hypothetical protein
METAFPSVVVGCVHSTLVTNSQNVLLISAEPSLSTLCTVLPFDTSPEEITFSGLSKISPRPKMLRKYSIEKKMTTSFIIIEEATNIRGKEKEAKRK